MGICMWTRVCSHDGYTHMCPCGLGACPWHRVLLAVSVHVCPTVCAHLGLCRVCTRVSHMCHTCVCMSVPAVPACAQLGLCGACTRVSVCKCPLCLYVGDTCRAGLPVSLCQVCTRMLLRVTVLRCACALIPILGGSVAPGCPCKSPPLAQRWPVACLGGSVRGSLCSRPPKPSFALIPRPGCGKRDPSPAPAAAAPPRPRSGLPGQGAPRPGWPVTLPAGSGFLAPQPLPRSAP